MRKFLELFLFLCSSFAGIAQNNLPPAFEIKTDTAERLGFNDSNWQILEDTTGKLTIDQVRRPSFANQFHPFSGVTKAHVYWLRCRVRNAMTHPTEIAMQWVVPYADEYTQNSSGEREHKISGFFVPWSQRDDLKKTLYLLYKLKPGEELLAYARVKETWYTIMRFAENPHVDLNVELASKLIHKNYIDDQPSALPPFIFGVFLVAALLNLYFFTVVRERVYLYFSLFILFESLARFHQDNPWVFFPEHPSISIYIVAGSFTFYSFFFIQFVRYFLKTFTHVPRWDKFLIVLSIYTIALGVFFLLNLVSLKTAYAEAISSESINFFATLTFLFFLKSPDRSVRLRVLAVLPAVLLYLVFKFPAYLDVFTELTGITIPDFWYFFYRHKFEQIAIAWLIIVFSVSLFRRFQQLQNQVALEAVEKEKLAKQKEIERSQLIEQQKIVLEKTVEERTAELKHSLIELKSTQSQLIHSEKMASLGELTAGIAHEIQNPLNFVNNFSEVNTELVDELKSELAIGNRQQAIEIADDIKDNSKKINHHGKRADAIVKGMLQHSRASSGQKELTDINALADEYLRLAYHGFRAKDKSFNTKFETDLDKTIGKIKVVPQDIGRVLLNLINNAFYAVDERKRQLDGSLPTGQAGYEPCVAISTRKFDGHIEVRVKDNGNGIPQKVLDKIFQPFFTTKPTGVGTGLGLSLSYDIIRAHDGEIKVETKQGEGSEFIIQLPA